MKNNEATAKILFKDEDVEAAKKMLLCDLWDTYQALINKKWNEAMTVDKETYLENTNFAIATLHIYAEGALECVKRNKCWHPKKFQKVKNKMNLMRAITIDDI